MSDARECGACNPIQLREWLCGLRCGVPTASTCVIMFSAHVNSGTTFLSRVLLQRDDYEPLPNDQCTYAATTLRDGSLLVVADIRGPVEEFIGLCEEREEALLAALDGVGTVRRKVILVVIPAASAQGGVVVDDALLSIPRELVHCVHGGSVGPVQWGIVFNKVGHKSFSTSDAADARDEVRQWEGRGVDITPPTLSDGGTVTATVRCVPVRSAGGSVLSVDMGALRAALLTSFVMGGVAAADDSSGVVYLEGMSVDVPLDDTTYWMHQNTRHYVDQRREERAWAANDKSRRK